MDAMTITSAVVRPVVTIFNAAGRALERAGIQPVSLDEESVLAAARRQTGLRDLEGEGVRVALGVLLRDYEREARLTPLGRLVARRDTVALLAQRIRLQEDRRRHPAIADQPIVRPVFIVGLPRTGSTLLHHLLACDPANRVARAWEVMTPSPPPEAALRETDPRIARAERQLRWLDRLAPAFKTIHPLGARLPLECMAITAHSFMSQRFHTMYRVPNYQEWLGRQDPHPAYEFHRQFLQHLQWRTTGRRWVLKAPSHAHGAEALFDTYPDAVVVQTHRDPVTVLASVANLTAVLRAAFAGGGDVLEIGAEVTRHWQEGLDRLLSLRSHPRFAGRFVDLHYHELVEDPLAAVRRLYGRLDLDLSEIAEARMRAHLAADPRDRPGPHTYSLGAFGLDADDLRRRFKAYRERFGIRAEPDPRWPAPGSRPGHSAAARSGT
jgi:hypothetical protein